MKIEAHLHQLGSPPFFLLEKKIVDSTSKTAIVLLPGLFEPRCGINYFFKEISDELCNMDLVTFQLDLAGCGESMLPLSVDMWRLQLSLVFRFLENYDHITLISRGASSVILPQINHKGGIISINPIDKTIFFPLYEEIKQSYLNEVWEPLSSMPEQERLFWHILGVEAECIGGLAISSKFWEQFIENVSDLSNHWKIVLTHSHQEKIKISHPLILQKEDRISLIEYLKTLLKEMIHAN